MDFDQRLGFVSDGSDRETIFYQHRDSLSGGALDVDANAACEHVTSQPVENIFWPTLEAPQGQYLVDVQYY